MEIALRFQPAALSFAHSRRLGYTSRTYRLQYIAHLLEVRARAPTQASPISLTRRQDLLELELPEPDLSIYEVPDDDCAD